MHSDRDCLKASLEQFVSGRVIGADGGIGGTYAVMPELYLAMNDHINKGEIKQAQEIQYEADRIIYKMCEAHGNLYAVQKEILRRMYGLELGGVREPMPGLLYCYFVFITYCFRHR